MKNTLTFILFAFIFNLSSAQELKKEYQDVVLTFIDCIQNKDTEKLKTLISYPLKREYPLPEIKGEVEFIKRYSEVFDYSLTNEIVKSNLKNDWSSVGWRGIKLNNGSLWLDYDGKLLTVNYQSDIERDKRTKIIETDRNSIHESLMEFKQPVLLIETKKFKIRIDELDNGSYRYASWPIDSSMNEKPDLIIKNGDWIPEGSGGNHRYEFNNGNYKYVCSINTLGTNETSPADLFVYNNGEKILAQPARIIKK